MCDRFWLSVGGRVLANSRCQKQDEAQDPNFGRVEIYDHPHRLQGPCRRWQLDWFIRVLGRGGVCYPPTDHARTLSDRPQTAARLALKSVEGGTTSFKRNFASVCGERAMMNR